MPKVKSVAQSDALFATNTSGIPIEAIAQAFDQEDKQRFFGMHFFNPPRIMKLVEIIPNANTAQEFLCSICVRNNFYQFHNAWWIEEMHTKESLLIFLIKSLCNSFNWNTRSICSKQSIRLCY